MSSILGNGRGIVRTTGRMRNDANFFCPCIKLENYFSSFARWRLVVLNKLNKKWTIHWNVFKVYNGEFHVIYNMNKRQ